MAKLRTREQRAAKNRYHPWRMKVPRTRSQYPPSTNRYLPSTIQCLLSTIQYHLSMNRYRPSARPTPAPVHRNSAFRLPRPHHPLVPAETVPSTPRAQMAPTRRCPYRYPLLPRPCPPLSYPRHPPQRPGHPPCPRPHRVSPWSWRTQMPGPSRGSWPSCSLPSRLPRRRRSRKLRISRPLYRSCVCVSSCKGSRRAPVPRVRPGRCHQSEVRRHQKQGRSQSRRLQGIVVSSGPWCKGRRESDWSREASSRSLRSRRGVPRALHDPGSAGFPLR